MIILKGIKYTREQFIALAAEYESAVKLAEHLGCNKLTIANVLKKHFPERRKGAKLSIGLLELDGKGKCNKCKEIKPLEDFYQDTRAHVVSGRRPECKVCHMNSIEVWRDNNRGLVNSYDAKRRSAKLQRTPAWADLEAIKKIYAECPEGMHVDHIVPLQGELVSGLHVENNLQYLTPSENASKNNSFTPS